MGDSTNHRADIQALRGVAILAVLSHHAGIPGLTLAAGYRGVDLFFVISGFVIATSLIDREDRGERYRVGAFLMRRVRRLFPAFLVTMVATICVGAIVQSYVGEYQQTAQTGAAATLLVANYFLLTRSVDYFTPLFPNPFLHTWSLSVEEQFYVVFAAALGVAGIWRLGLRSRTLRLAVPIALAASWAASRWPERLPNFERYFSNQDLFPFYSFHSRAWQILAGVVVAQHARTWSGLPRSARLVGRLGALAVTATALAVGGHEHRVGGGAAAITLASAALLATGGGPGRGLGPAATRALASIGDRSYSLYLVHWPVLLLGIRLLGGSAITRLALVLTAAVLTEWLHRRIEFAWRATPGRRIAALGMGGLACSLALSSVAVSFADRRLEGAAAMPVWDRIPAECVRERDLVVGDDGQYRDAAGESTLWCSTSIASSRIGFAFEGDSHGGSLVREFLATSDRLGASARLFAMTNDGPTGPAARELGRSLDADLRWILGSYFRQNVDVAMYEQHLVELSRVEHVAALVVYLDNPFIETWRAPSLLRGPVDQSRSRSEELRPDDRLQMLERLAPTLPIPLVIVDPFDAVCDETTCFGGRDGLVWYIDEDHLSVGGMRQLQDLTTRAFRDAMERAGVAG